MIYRKISKKEKTNAILVYRRRVGKQISVKQIIISPFLISGIYTKTK